MFRHVRSWRGYITQPFVDENRLQRGSRTYRPARSVAACSNSPINGRCPVLAAEEHSTGCFDALRDVKCRRYSAAVVSRVAGQNDCRKPMCRCCKTREMVREAIRLRSTRPPVVCEDCDLRACKTYNGENKTYMHVSHTNGRRFVPCR